MRHCDSFALANQYWTHVRPEGVERQYGSRLVGWSWLTVWQVEEIDAQAWRSKEVVRPFQAVLPGNRFIRPSATRVSKRHTWKLSLGIEVSTRAEPAAGGQLWPARLHTLCAPAAFVSLDLLHLDEKVLKWLLLVQPKHKKRSGSRVPDLSWHYPDGWFWGHKLLWNDSFWTSD